MQGMSSILTQRQAWNKINVGRIAPLASPACTFLPGNLWIGKRKQGFLVKCPKKTKANNGFFLITPRFEETVLRKMFWL